MRPIGLLLCVLPLMAADVTVWSAADLHKEHKGVKGFASEPLGEFGNHHAMLAHRVGGGSAELHETDADLFVIETGKAKLITGGSIVGAKTTAPHEVRGPSIKGGTEKTVSAGDIVHIPAKVPHQLIPQGSGQFTYFVMKVGGQ